MSKPRSFFWTIAGRQSGRTEKRRNGPGACSGDTYVPSSSNVPAIYDKVHAQTRAPSSPEYINLRVYPCVFLCTQVCTRVPVHGTYVCGCAKLRDRGLLSLIGAPATPPPSSPSLWPRVRVEPTKRKSFGQRSLDNRAPSYSRASSRQREDTLRCNCSLPIRVEIIARRGTRNCPETLGFFFHGGQLLRGFGRKGVASRASTRISLSLQFHDRLTTARCPVTSRSILADRNRICAGERYDLEGTRPVRHCRLSRGRSALLRNGSPPSALYSPIDTRFTLRFGVKEPVARAAVPRAPRWGILQPRGRILARSSPLFYFSFLFGRIVSIFRFPESHAFPLRSFPKRAVGSMVLETATVYAPKE